MSILMKLLHCPFCDKIVCGYQELLTHDCGYHELLNHVQSRQINQSNEMYTIEGSNILRIQSSKPSESVQHVRTRVDSQSIPSPPLFHPSWVSGNDSYTYLHANQELPLSLPPPPSSSDRMASHLSLVHCPICDKSVHGYQVFMNHVLSHPLDNEMEIDAVQGSNNLSESLQTPSELVQHARTMLMSSPPSSYGAHFIRGNDDGKVMHKNLQLPTPTAPSYLAGSIRRNIDDRDVNTNQQLLPPLPSYRSLTHRGNDNNIGVQADQLQQNTSTVKEGPIYEI